MGSWSVGGVVGPISRAPEPWSNLFWVPVNGPFGVFQFMAGALAIPGEFAVQNGDYLMVWICRPGTGG